MNNDTSDVKNAMADLQSKLGFELASCHTDLENINKYDRIPMNGEQKSYICELIHEIPALAGAAELANAYVVRFPNGLPHTLTPLKRGGYSTAIQGADGRFIGSASLHEASRYAVVLGAFSIMSAASGQYYLTQINDEIRVVNQKLDEILTFLYGDKRAELVSEIGFVQYAHHNYASIMMHEDQRIATITSLQRTRKIAMQDIEFYSNDLDRKVCRQIKDFGELKALADEAIQIKNSLELSRQLYVVSCLLELYYAQNYDAEYIDYVQKDMTDQINASNARILEALSKLHGQLNVYKAKPLEKMEGKEIYLDGITKATEPYRTGRDTPIHTAMKNTLSSLNAESEFYFSSDGDMFIRKVA